MLQEDDDAGCAVVWARRTEIDVRHNMSIPGSTGTFVCASGSFLSSGVCRSLRQFRPPFRSASWERCIYPFWEIVVAFLRDWRNTPLQPIPPDWSDVCCMVGIDWILELLSFTSYVDAEIKKQCLTFRFRLVEGLHIRKPLQSWRGMIRFSRALFVHWYRWDYEGSDCKVYEGIKLLVCRG